MKYELQDLLRVRNLRKNRANDAVLKAKRHLAETEELVAKSEKKLNDFIAVKPKYIDQIYVRALNKKSFKRNYMDLITLKISKLDEHQSKLAIELKKAQDIRELALKDLEKCREALKQATVDLDKIEEHKKTWQAEVAILDQLAEDKELEDFKTKKQT